MFYRTYRSLLVIHGVFVSMVCGWCVLGLFVFRFVAYASSDEEHNLTVFQFYRQIYYRASQPISEGAELKVSIGKDYAAMLGLGMGEFCEG